MSLNTLALQWWQQSAMSTITCGYVQVDPKLSVQVQLLVQLTGAFALACIVFVACDLVQMTSNLVGTLVSQRMLDLVLATFMHSDPCI
jgi:hypothetical protein